MPVNKVVYGGRTLIDISDSNVTEENLIKDITAYGANGEKIIGTLIVQSYYTGNTEPSNSFGNDGDLYLVTG